ncbi:hypothetical protein GP486_001100 [Trichoglossum hirsutum]|uniref:Uncharacterized protein n=1 Tax=Trichoglossum hirsutum TaxID=265104 RepID=A0A9P8LHB2_9PEZI|nr:hypothetical protein GP486_001100 [Trichoglossum hirsutum]
MALASVASTSTLSRWGYCPSDISVIVGAGRTVGTWVMAQLKDQALLDFMRVAPEDLVVRRGLIDMNSLHRRWDVSLTLLQNGKLCRIDHCGNTVVENMSKFSWLMTLIISGLDASMQLADVRKVMTTFLTALFQEQVDGLDYLLRELPQHIQGWMSAACVRNILTRAREEWATLAARGKHLPGQIPSADVEEIQQLLIWLVGARNQERERAFKTNSTDVFSLALVLQAIGLDIATSCDFNSEHDESQLVVILTEDMILSKGRQYKRESQDHRLGMRIPLDSMQECVSLWPGTSEENNERRRLFIDGMKAASDLSFRCMRIPTSTLKNPEIIYAIINGSPRRVDRVDDQIFRLAEDLFPLTTFKTVQALRDIIPGHLSQANDSTLLDQLRSDHGVLAEVQLFTMGFYYALLRTLLDTSQLELQEAYGSWKWYDHELLHQIRDVLRDTKQHTRKLTKLTPKPTAGLKRGSILKLLALFFAGAEKDQITWVSDSIIGVHAKLSLLSASTLGNADTPDKVSKFFLLDVDATAIPSNARGLVTGGANRSELHTCIVPDQRECLESIENVRPGGLEVDFTTHVEPDWEYDIQSCTVVFRYRGRVIRRLSPLAIDLALLPETEQPPHITSTTTSPEHQPNKTSPPVVLGDISSFSSGYLGHPTNTDSDESTLPTIVLATKGCSKARTCLRTIYHLENYKLLCVPNPFPGVRWIHEGRCTQNGADSGEVIVLYQPTVNSWEDSTRKIVIV